MKVFAFSRTAAVGLALAATLGGCSLLPAARTGSTAGSGATTTPGVDAASVLSSLAPLVRSAAGQNNHPPDGLLSSGSEGVVGQPGSFCYGNTCVDIGRWSPKAELPRVEAKGRSLHFTLSNGEPFVFWHASYAAKSDSQGSRGLGRGGDAFDPDANPTAVERFTDATFNAPPAGDWVVWLYVGLAPGDLTYAWHVTVMPDTATDS